MKSNTSANLFPNKKPRGSNHSSHYIKKAYKGQGKKPPRFNIRGGVAYQEPINLFSVNAVPLQGNDGFGVGNFAFFNHFISFFQREFLQV